MKLTRRKGWIRLGIVLSLAWFVFVSIYAIFEHQSTKTYYTASEIQLYNMSLGLPKVEVPEEFKELFNRGLVAREEGFCEGMETFLSSCTRVEEEQGSSTPQSDEQEKYRVIKVSCTTRWINLLGLYLVPVAVSWMLVYIVVFAVIWVRAGFRND